jgi:uncharacterized protein
VKKIPVEVIGIFVDQLSDHPHEARFTLLLGELQGDRKLPIMIGLVEAQAIALALERATLERPLMYDLFKEAILKLGCTVQEAVIVGLKNDIFFADLHLAMGVHRYTMDARPSDAIAISLRLGAPIFVYEELLKQVGSILIKKFEHSDSEQPFPKVEGTPLEQGHEENLKNFESYSVQALQELLATVVDREEYEKAALIRDELKRRE